MLGDEPLPEERPERMAEEDDRNARLLLGDQPVHGPEIADDFSPSAVVGEMAEVGGGRLRPVATMVVRINRIARGVERRGEAGVTGAVLGEAVGDLHHRPRPPFRQPAPGQKALPVVGAKLELAPRHSRPARSLPAFECAGWSMEFDADLEPPSSGRLGPIRPRGAGRNFLLAESSAIG